MTAPDFTSLAMPGVRRLQPYQGGKPVDELAREYGLTDIIKLASNENPLGPSPLALTAMQHALNDTARYPDGNGFVLRAALARHLGVNMDCITLGNGSNDVLDLIARAFAGPDCEIMFSAHAFAVYPIVTAAVGATPVVVPAKNWGYDLVALRQALTDKTRIVFVANPNNPTGTWLTGAELEAFLEQVPSHVFVVMDEAYFEYVQVPGYLSTLAWLNRFPNLIVTRTFSKAYGLAGLRIGYGVSHPGIAELLNRVRQPFNINTPALAAATAALEDKLHLQRSIETNNAGMLQLVSGCEQLGLHYIPSVGNFLCIAFTQPTLAVYEALLRAGIIVRPVANYGMPDYLRVTVGREEENARLLTALKRILA